MATAGTSHQQEGTNSYSNHFDIMLIGRTGHGKSTTADKLLVANPTGKIYTCEGTQNKDLDDSESSGCPGDIEAYQGFTAIAMKVLNFIVRIYQCGMILRMTMICKW